LDEKNIRVDMRKKRLEGGNFLRTSKPSDIERKNDHKDTREIDWPSLRANVEGKTVFTDR
jgi:hypothetical protein